MFRRLFTKKDNEHLTAAEEVAVSRLATLHSRLILDNEQLDTRSEAGILACSSFLEGLDVTANMLRLEKASRSYRTAFTINYRALFPNEARSYRVDVLEASAEQYAVIWVNGDKFEFTPEAMNRAETLQRAWEGVTSLLDRWQKASDPASALERPKVGELKWGLENLDIAWASFEEKYIKELIDIEEKARRLIVEAVEHEELLGKLEVQHFDQSSEALQSITEYRQQQKTLVGCITHLNSVANTRRKGRDDLEADILADAVQVVAKHKASAAGIKGPSAGHILAMDIVESFAALRSYLRKVKECIERIDPHLCNNSGLVERLVDWEESWELGVRYIQREAVLNAVCDIVASVREVQTLAPAFAAMCENCEAELFMVLPRIVWLRFLVKPQQQAALLGDLLPHRFNGWKPEDNASTSKRIRGFNWEINALLEKFEEVRRLLAGKQSRGVPIAETAAWEILARRVVDGVAGGGADALPVDGRALDTRSHAAVDGLVHQLERWSIELQRHCPEDWNQCCAILVRCLIGENSGRQRQKEASFHV